MSDARPNAPLTGRHVLIVEDEMIVAMDLGDVIASMGGTSATAGRVAKAVALAAAQKFDVAILDLNLAGEVVYPVADELARRGVPYIIASGYGADGILAAYRGATLLGKPYARHEVEAALLKVLALTSAKRSSKL